MPTYDYRCGSCRHLFELFESLSAEGTKICPKCGRKRARRLLGCGSAPVIRGNVPPRRGIG